MHRFAAMNLALARAQTLFAARGYPKAATDFQLDLGRDADEAADFALRVFTEVHQLRPDFPLQVDEH